MLVSNGIIDKLLYAVTKTEIEEQKEELYIAAVGTINNNGIVNYDKLNSSLPEGFKESDGVYIKGNNKYIVNTYGKVDTLLPQGYKECEYLESNGKQYIDTEYIPTKNTNINIKYKLPTWFNHASSYTLVGSNSLYVKFYRFSGGLTNNFKKGNNVAEIYKWGFNYGDIYELSIKDSDVKVVKPEGTYTGKIDLDFTNITSLPIYMWALNTETGASEKITGTIYSFIIYEKNVITANFIPALDTDNRPCLFDAIRRKTFYNQGTEDFLYEVKQ